MNAPAPCLDAEPKLFDGESRRRNNGEQAARITLWAWSRSIPLSQHSVTSKNSLSLRSSRKLFEMFVSKSFHLRVENRYGYRLTFKTTTNPQSPNFFIPRTPNKVQIKVSLLTWDRNCLLQLPLPNSWWDVFIFLMWCENDRMVSIFTTTLISQLF